MPWLEFDPLRPWTEPNLEIVDGRNAPWRCTTIKDGCVRPTPPLNVMHLAAMADVRNTGLATERRDTGTPALPYED